MAKRFGATCVAFAWLAVPAPGGAEGEPSAAELHRQLERVLEQNRALQERVDALENDVRSARDEARAAREATRALPPVSTASRDGALWSAPLGSGARLQLMDVSLDVLTSAGFSSARDDDLELLQGGGHDPRRRGFNLQNVELSFLGAVDPWFTGEAHLITFLDPEGESRFEIE
jgi:hypothetical protein